jgi:hypothetical protein
LGTGLDENAQACKPRTGLLVRERAVPCLIAGASLVVGLATPAAAHYVYQRDLVFRSGDNCTEVRTEISHGNGNGYFKGETKSLTNQLVFGACESGYARPPGHIKARLILFKHQGGRWKICQDIGEWMNHRKVEKVVVPVTQQSRPPCGSGNYALDTHGHVLYNSRWQGGKLSSGVHRLPA